jgi:hypothetical protein
VELFNHDEIVYGSIMTMMRCWLSMRKKVVSENKSEERDREMNLINIITHIHTLAHIVWINNECNHKYYKYEMLFLLQLLMLMPFDVCYKNNDNDDCYLIINAAPNKNRMFIDWHHFDVVPWHCVVKFTKLIFAWNKNRFLIKFLFTFSSKFSTDAKDSILKF